MKTRISKISRLPKPLREQLNQRIENGDMGRRIVEWLNAQPETKTVMARDFDGRAITTQNLSEWRRTGYQDWLLHQDRLQWFARLAEQDVEIDQQNRTGDPFETMGALFLYDIGQALTTLHHIKNPHERFDRLETLTREFARLQNAFNWSRRTQLEFDKHAATRGRPSVPTLFAPKPSPPAAQPKPSPQTEAPNPKPETTSRPEAGGASVPASRSLLETPNPKLETPPSSILDPQPSTPPSNPQPLNTVQAGQTASTPTPQPRSPLNPQPLTSQPTPPPPPIRRPGYDDPRPPIRGRRFVCIEG